jgi:hypothetical protein
MRRQGDEKPLSLRRKRWLTGLSGMLPWQMRGGRRQSARQSLVEARSYGNRGTDGKGDGQRAAARIVAR